MGMLKELLIRAVVPPARVNGFDKRSASDALVALTEDRPAQIKFVAF
jgi:hypothetical protein